MELQLVGTYLIYTCLHTHPPIKSTNYKARTFTSTYHPETNPRPVTILSKNSPEILDLDTLALQGAFPEFDHRPAVLFLHADPTEAHTLYLNFCQAVTIALDEYLVHLGYDLEPKATS